MADPRDLTTLDSLKALLGKTGTDQDTLLQDMLTEASVMLTRELGRELVPANGVLRNYKVQDGGYVETPDIRVVHAITWDVESTGPVTLSDPTVDWRLRPVFAQDGVYQAVYLPNYRWACNTTWGSESTVVQVLGDFGFAAIPPDVARGVKITVKTWLREGATFTPDGDVIRFERVGRVPQDVLDGLEHYRIPRV